MSRSDIAAVKSLTLGTVFYSTEQCTFNQFFFYLPCVLSCLWHLQHPPFDHCYVNSILDNFGGPIRPSQACQTRRLPGLHPLARVTLDSVPKQAFVSLEIPGGEEPVLSGSVSKSKC